MLTLALNRLRAVFQPATNADSAEARGHERFRRALLTVLALFAARGVTVLTSIVSVPLAIGYLDLERYGLWMTITSLTMLMSFADFGLGNGLLNAVARAKGQGDTASIRRYFFTALVFLSAVALGIGLLFAAVFPFVSWPEFFNTRSAIAASEAGPAVAVWMACFLLGIPLGVASRVQLAHQEGFATSLWTALGTVLSLGALVLVVYLKASLPWLVLAASGAPLVASGLNAITFVGVQRRDLMPSLRDWSRPAAKELWGTGLLFFALQFAAAVGFSSDNLVITKLFSPDAVAEYSTAVRLFSYVSAILAMCLSPLWPAYSEALARGDVAWATRTLKQTMLISLVLTSVLVAPLVPFGGWIIEHWSRKPIAPSFALALGIAVWTVMYTIGNALAMFLNGANMMRVQLFPAIAFLIVGFGAKVAFGSWFGLPGLPWGTLAAYTITAVVPFALMVPGRIRQMSAAAAPQP